MVEIHIQMPSPKIFSLKFLCDLKQKLLKKYVNIPCLCSLAPRHLPVTWMTSSATGGSWKRESQTLSEKHPLSISQPALRWSWCIGSVITGWMLQMSLTCSRYTTYTFWGNRSTDDKIFGILLENPTDVPVTFNVIFMQNITMYLELNINWQFISELK